MQQIPQIKAAYDWMMAAYQAEVPEALAAGNLDRLEEKRDILERGVFVMLFGQFENAVNDLFEAACDARSANPDWLRRRGWDVPGYMDRKIAGDAFRSRPSSPWCLMVASPPARRSCTLTAFEVIRPMVESPRRLLR